MVYLLLIVSMVQGYPDTEIATFATARQCYQEAEKIISQGPSAYCRAVTKEST